MKYLSIIISLLFIIKLSNCAINNWTGCIEGYYWTPADSVNGNYGQFTFTQRKQLIQLMSSYNIGVYWWSPQSVDTMSLWNSTVVDQWKDISSLGNSLGVKIVVGIRPGYLETDSFATVLERLLQIHSTGINYYTLNFDDGEGVSTTEQQQLEVQLVSYLNENLPSEMVLYAILPFAYYQDMFSSRTEWESVLSTIDGVPANIPFVFTGTQIAPTTFDSSQFPTLKSNRNLKFFDNWIAGDTSKRISWGMIDGRVNSNIFTSSYGYILNLAYPLERIIHHLYCEGQLSSGYQTCDVSIAAQQWADWLNNNGFLNESQNVANVKTSLEAAIYEDHYYNSIDELYTEYPNLNGIFTTPPTESSESSESSGSSTSSQDNSSTSTSQDGSSTNTASSNFIINSSVFLIILLVNLLK